MEAKERIGFPDPKENALKAHPADRANFLSKFFFCWTFPLFVKGFKTDLTEDDLHGPRRIHESQQLGDTLERAWEGQVERCKERASLLRALLQVFGWEFSLYGVVYIVTELGLRLNHPLLLRRLLRYYDSGSGMSKEEAYVYASGIGLVLLLNVLFGHHNVFGLQQLGMKLRVACCSLIYRKALRLNQSAFLNTSVGQMVNLLSNDVNRFDMSLITLHCLWMGPLETAIVLYMIYANMGVTGLAGALVLLIFIPIQVYMGRKTSTFRMRTALKTDQRIRLMNEIISGIQVIKMYTWEKPFTKLVEKARLQELQQIRLVSYIRAMNLSFMAYLNRASIFLCVLVYILTGNVIQAEYVYVVSSFYGILQSVVMFLPQAATSMVETNVSIKRIQTFMNYSEVERRAPEELPTEEETAGVHMKNFSAKWVESSDEYNLNDIDFEAGPKQLIGVIGTVGSGKTTLLNAILKELSASEGSLKVNGRISYACQEPWLFSGSIKQNILFGQAMDIEKYREIVRVCALERDFKLFPFGDQTLVGERGVMLSGGQKARINLARAIYKDAEIYLLDDPLSAVDTHVARQLFDDCISGYLKNKCTVLVTHQLQYLKKVHKLYVLENGRIAVSGTYEDLQSSSTNLYAKLLEEDSTNKDPEVEDAKKYVREDSYREPDAAGPEELEAENRTMGVISGRTYKAYLRSGGNLCRLLLVILLLLLAQTGASLTDYYLAQWVNIEQDHQNSTSSQILNAMKNRTLLFEVEEWLLTSYNSIYVYTGLLLFTILITVTRSLVYFSFCIRAGKNLHNNMFAKIVYSDMLFFNNNPSGRILNRFSKDMGSIDEMLPLTVVDTVQIALMVLGSTILVCFVNPWNLIPTAVVLVVFYCYKQIYVTTSRDLKRMEGTTKSPVFSHLTASLQGLTTIRAFSAQEVLKLEFDRHQNLHSSSYHAYLSCSRTFGFWLDLHCAAYVAVVILSFLIISNETHSGNVGFTITTLVTFTGMIQWGMRQWGETENQMTSVERVVEYTEITPEADVPNVPPKTWPDHGAIEFHNLSLRYSSSGPRILKDLTFTIEPKQKIGIVGRTGAGKSSIIASLFRLAPIEGGIKIDGIDTKTISLNSLRSKISIIPQDPVLFSGTLRKNLDPFDEYDDATLWSALTDVELKSQIPETLGLQTVVSEGGSNFSVGQKQLLCLARAIIRNNRILVLDEATANVDPQTDELIQNTIRTKFSECTVLTIAHRLQTIMDSDKVLVMSEGSAVEFDHPHLLLEKKGAFYRLVMRTGRDLADRLEGAARRSYQRTRSIFD